MMEKKREGEARGTSKKRLSSQAARSQVMLEATRFDSETFDMHMSPM